MGRLPERHPKKAINALMGHYPRLVAEGDQANARKLLVDFCSASRLSEMMAEWWTVTEFNNRKLLFDQALSTHAAGQYFLSVSTLVPHIEGVITDWLHSKLPNLPWRQNAKTKKFRDEIASYPDATPAYQQVLHSAISFLLDGSVLADFTDWYASFDTSFANRNVVGHGRFDEQVYSEENSAKLFLMLDTLRQLISAYGTVIVQGDEA